MWLKHTPLYVFRRDNGKYRDVEKRRKMWGDACMFALERPLKRKRRRGKERKIAVEAYSPFFERETAEAEETPERRQLRVKHILHILPFRWMCGKRRDMRESESFPKAYFSRLTEDHWRRGDVRERERGEKEKEEIVGKAYFFVLNCRHKWPSFFCLMKKLLYFLFCVSCVLCVCVFGSGNRDVKMQIFSYIFGGGSSSSKKGNNSLYAGEARCSIQIDTIEFSFSLSLSL